MPITLLSIKHLQDVIARLFSFKASPILAKTIVPAGIILPFNIDNSNSSI